MSRTSILIDAPPDAVFAVLDDACAYPAWVVGARRVRHVDAEWPAEGSRFHHALGGPGAEIHDSTKVLERDPPDHLRLEVRFRPAGVAEVDLWLTPTAAGTRVVMDERPRSGPAAVVSRRLVDPLLHARNLWSLRRLRDEVRRRARSSSEPSIGTLLGPRTVATAESCTGGLVAQALVRESGSGDWFRGGVITYMRDTKSDLLDVSPGPVVTTRAACEMAEGVAARFGADVGVSVTGAAGPDPHDGAAPGTVVIGVLVDGEVRAHVCHFDGDPAEVCARATEQALGLLRTRLIGDHAPAPAVSSTAASEA